MKEFLRSAVAHSSQKEFFSKFMLFKKETLATCNKCNQQQTFIGNSCPYLDLYGAQFREQTPTVKDLIEDHFKKMSMKLNCKECKGELTDELTHFHGK